MSSYSFGKSSKSRIRINSGMVMKFTEITFNEW